MPKKQKFKPIITRVKLNPEQAVLLCNCFSNTFNFTGVAWQTSNMTTYAFCTGPKTQVSNYFCDNAGSIYIGGTKTDSVSQS